MKFCKSCNKKLPKDEKLNHCHECLYNEEKENFECDFDNEEGLTCIYQYNMFRQGNVMTPEGNWLNEDDAKKYPRPEELQDYVDFWFLHNSGNCLEYYKHVDPKGYEDQMKQRSKKK